MCLTVSDPAFQLVRTTRGPHPVTSGINSPSQICDIYSFDQYPPEFSSNDKSDRIKGDLGTLQETSLKIDTQRREWNTAPLGSKEMELEQGSLHTHPWDCLGLPLYATASTSCSSS